MPSTTPPYDQIVSLGKNCQPAHQIRRFTGVTSAHLFDWLITPDDGLVMHISADLDGFFARERLAMGRSCIVDVVTDTRFFHEFPKDSDFDQQYLEHQGRLAMLADRWRDLLRSDQRVLFVRQHAWNEDRRATARRLRDALAAQAPRLRFDLLYLTGEPADDEPWGEHGIINRFLTQPVPYVWTGDDSAWDRLLADAIAAALARDTHTGSYPHSSRYGFIRFITDRLSRSRVFQRSRSGS